MTVSEEAVGGLGLMTTRDLKKDEVLIQVPQDLILQSNGDDSIPREHRSVYRDVAWWAQLSLQLHFLDESYQTWLQSLPTVKQNQQSLPFHWSSQLIEELQYSHLKDSVELQRQLWKAEYDKIVTASSSLQISMEQFIWGCEMARSRAFSGSFSGKAFSPTPFLFTLLFMAVYLGLNMGTLDQAANGAGVVLCGLVFQDFIFPKLFSSKKKNYVICPMIDMANHDTMKSIFANVAFEYFANGYSLATTTTATTADVVVKEGTELFISYGPRSNDQLLQYYGFVEVDNPNDVYIMPPLREWDIGALEECCGRTFNAGRLQKLDKAGLLGLEGKMQDLDAENRGGGVVVDRINGLDPAVLTALRVLVSSEEEWTNAGEAIGNFVTVNSAGPTNERLARLAATKALQMELDSKPTTLEEDLQLSKQKNTLDDDEYEQKQLALQFRIQKKKLLKDAIQKIQP